MKSRLQLIVEEEKLCKDRKREILYCKAYKFDFCPLICTYAEKMLSPEDCAKAIELRDSIQLTMPNLNYAARIKNSRGRKSSYI